MTTLAATIICGVVAIAVGAFCTRLVLLSIISIRSLCPTVKFEDCTVDCSYSRDSLLWGCHRSLRTLRANGDAKHFDIHPTTTTNLPVFMLISWLLPHLWRLTCLQSACLSGRTGERFMCLLI